MQINGVDIYNFPDKAKVSHMLYWMGDDYIEYITNTLLSEFKKQDSKTELIAIKCESDFDFTTKTDRAGGISSIKLSFQVQVLVKDGNNKHWRLRGINTYVASNLPDDISITISFELIQSEPA